MTPATYAKVPAHLRRFVVDQNYARYTAQDQAVWRYLLRQLGDFLGRFAHPIYREGLTLSGISPEQIPRIESIDEHLEKFGWGAVPVSGFIPPAAFMEFQSLGVLPIASDIRSLDHLVYTPAPDIVHEAAGHAPILVDAEYSAFLRAYGEVARHALIAQEDLDQYEAIRSLSDIKGDPRSTWAEISKAERHLIDVNSRIHKISEAARLSRLNWWTAEYGLIGTLDQPRLFGAGLLSSLEESRTCLTAKVKKIPLSLECVDVGYDITEMQPQLFVARNFGHLSEVVAELATTMAYRQTGLIALRANQNAKTINTVEFESGLQVAGRLDEILVGEDGQPIYLIFSGPTQLAFDHRELSGQGPKRHPAGFSMAIAPADILKPLGSAGRVDFNLPSGVQIRGNVIKHILYNDRDSILTLGDCEVRLKDRVLFNPAWGEYDLVLGGSVRTVFSGPADRLAFGELEAFAYRPNARANLNASERSAHDFYARLRALRENSRPQLSEFKLLVETYLTFGAHEWLPGVELLELSYALGLSDADRRPLMTRLDPSAYQNPGVRQSVADGVRLATQA